MRVARASAGAALLAALTVLSAGGLTGQEKDRKTSDPTKKVAKGELPRNWEKLALTGSQREEIVKLNAEYKAKADKLEDDLRRLRAELARKRVAVLNDEQRKKLVDLVATDSLNEKSADNEKGSLEKEKPKGKSPDK